VLRASPLLEPPEGRRDRNTPRGVSEEGRGRIGADLVLRREGQLPRARDTKLAPFTSNLCSPRPFSTTLTLDLPSCNSGRRPIHYHLGCVTGTRSPLQRSRTRCVPLFPRLRNQRAPQGLHTLPSSPEPRLSVCRALVTPFVAPTQGTRPGSLIGEPRPAKEPASTQRRRSQGMEPRPESVLYDATGADP